MTDTPKTTLRRRTLLAAAVALLGLAGAGSAFADPGLADLQVVNRDTGQVLRTWRHHGRLFVAGEPGARYALRIANHSSGRVMLVVSVDGVNIVTGQTASYDQIGYVLRPYESYDVTGWRKSNTEVAAFAFAPLPQSYAARTGRPNDVGVIGMAVFTEKAPPEPVYAPPPPERGGWEGEANRDSAAAQDYAAPRRAAPAPPSPPPPASMAAPGRSAGIVAPRDDKLGTAHGAREWSAVGSTTFDKATRYPQSIRQIEYDTYRNLVASGVIPPAPPPERHPQPFPNGGGYVPDPPE